MYFAAVVLRIEEGAKVTDLLALSWSGVTVTERDSRRPGHRLRRLLDAGSIVPLAGDDGCGVVSVRGRINGLPVIAYCTDATVMGGSLGYAGSERIVAAIDAATGEDCPVIGLWHSGGARLIDGVESMDGVGNVFAAMTRASGRVPQISVVLGPAAGAAAYGPALTDIVIMSAGARIFVTGPEVVHSATGERVDIDDLGGSHAHGRKSGLAHVVADSDDAAYRRARDLVGLLGEPGRFDPDAMSGGTDPRASLPASPRRAYDVRPLVRALLDDDGAGSGYCELQPKWATNITVGLGRLAGRTVGVVANNPLFKGGCLDATGAEKAARFVRMCDSFGVPLVVVADVPGYLPGVEQEWGGVVRRGAKLLHAFAEAVVPRVTLVTRKAYGGAYIAMNSRALGASAVYAWPAATVAVMSGEAAVRVIHRRALSEVPAENLEAARSRLVDGYETAEGGLARAVALGVVDEVIEPGRTRRRLATALAAAPARRGRHGNIPL
jgi:acetyl-CoA/propionyl-CoA carboxylase carboxyl transferase subunit